ncbi:HugZ family protein [Oceanicoccus sp. KOV_DT_Chl]|uniref:HugZ family pyridoxamine 5'-phosphate oxidase n=1 Tax=Oceanicoccus sp. KOV_DT_Chl TaxID=1904639 RepID=UPI000C7BE89E|nr:pyridoxamine 5'-phosphate oxidase family protein [Oceanicoccus sp. KOV_DT_Chl]
MKNKSMELRLADELETFLKERRTLHLSSLDVDGHPYASYAPFAKGDNCLYVLLSDIAVHGINLKNNSKAAVLIIEDETEAQTIFARIRVNYQVTAEHIAFDAGTTYDEGIEYLYQKQGERVLNLSQLSDFHLFKLTPLGGRFIKDFGRAYTIAGKSLTGETIEHLRDGHKPRAKG